MKSAGRGWGGLGLWGGVLLQPAGAPGVPKAAVDGAPLRDRILFQSLPKTGMGAKAAA